MRRAEFDYQITEPLGTIRDSGRYQLELNLVSWNGREPKYDLRTWAVNGDDRIPLKGMTLDDDEAHALYELLKDSL